MSHVTVEEVVTLTARAYRLPDGGLHKRVSASIPPRRVIEARAMVAVLVLKHTQASLAEVTEAFGLRDPHIGAELRRQAARILGMIECDPIRAELLERIEQGIDSIHEARTSVDREQPTAVAPPAPRRSKISPPRPVHEREASIEWWASNDAVFRRAFLQAAE